jgi:hypothetical protein
MTTVVKIGQSDLFIVSVQSLVTLHTEQTGVAVMPGFSSRSVRFESRHGGRPDSGISWFFLGPQRKCRGGTLIRPWRLPSKSFQIHRSSVILAFDAKQSSYWRRPKINTQRSKITVYLHVMSGSLVDRLLYQTTRHHIPEHRKDFQPWEHES